MHSYVTRKNSVTAVREDQMRLKHEGNEFAICAYTKGDGTPVTPESFKRRAYWLKENPKYVVVHYLDEADKYYMQWMSLQQQYIQKNNNSSLLDFTLPLFDDSKSMFLG